MVKIVVCGIKEWNAHCIFCFNRILIIKNSFCFCFVGKRQGQSKNMSTNSTLVTDTYDEWRSRMVSTNDLSKYGHEYWYAMYDYDIHPGDQECYDRWIKVFWKIHMQQGWKALNHLFRSESNGNRDSESKKDRMSKFKDE